MLYGAPAREESRIGWIGCGNCSALHGWAMDTVTLAGPHREAALQRFAGGQHHVALCMVESCGVAIDLPRASFCIFLELPDAASELSQAVARLHRQGQRSAVTALQCRTRLKRASHMQSGSDRHRQPCMVDYVREVWLQRREPVKMQRLQPLPRAWYLRTHAATGYQQIVQCAAYAGEEELGHITSGRGCCSSVLP